MKHRSRLRARAVAAAVASALAVITPATVASATPCDELEGCRSAQIGWQQGWVTHVDADGRGSYSKVSLYRVDSHGHCFDDHGVGVGCP